MTQERLVRRCRASAAIAIVVAFSLLAAGFHRENWFSTSTSNRVRISLAT